MEDFLVPGGEIAPLSAPKSRESVPSTILLSLPHLQASHLSIQATVLEPVPHLPGGCWAPTMLYELLGKELFLALTDTLTTLLSLLNPNCKFEFANCTSRLASVWFCCQISRTY